MSSVSHHIRVRDSLCLILSHLSDGLSHFDWGVIQELIPLLVLFFQWFLHLTPTHSLSLSLSPPPEVIFSSDQSLISSSNSNRGKKRVFRKRRRKMRQFDLSSGECYIRREWEESCWVTKEMNRRWERESTEDREKKNLRSEFWMKKSAKWVKEMKLAKSRKEMWCVSVLSIVRLYTHLDKIMGL